MFLTLLDLLTAIGKYVNLRKKNKKHKISHKFRTECQELPFIRTSTCTCRKMYVLLDLFAKDTACLQAHTEKFT